MKHIVVILLLVLVNVNYKKDVFLDNDSQLEKCFLIAEKESNSRTLRINKSEDVMLILNKLTNDSINREKILRIGFNFYKLNDWKNLKKAAILLENKSKSVRDEISIADSYSLYGLYYENLSINDTAFNYYLKAKKIYEKKIQFKKLCIVLIDIANLQYYLNDYLGSESSLIHALKIARQYEFLNEEFVIYSMLGINSNELEEYDKALHYHIKALKLGKKNNLLDYKCLIECLNNIGYNFITSDQNDLGIKFFKLILTRCEIKKYPFMDAKVRDNYAKAKLNQGQLSEIRSLLTYADSVRHKHKILQGQNFNRLYLSEYYAATKDTIKALHYSNEAFKLSESFKAPGDMLLCLKHMSDIDPENALMYSKEYIKISDSMHRMERETRNKFAKIAYETEEIIQEKELAEKHKSIWLGTAVTITGFGILLFVILRQRIKQKELLLAQNQQEAKEEIYQLIHNQQSKIDEVRQIEKERIARDLHDGIMNRLASTRFNLHILNNKTDSETIKKCITYIDSIHDIEKEIRNISHNLNRDVFSDNDSFKRILINFLEEQQNILKPKLHAEIENDIDWELLKSSHKINLYRIMQEVFQNANKHSHADHIFVNIGSQKEYLLLEIHDDGVGFSTESKRKGIGLQNLRTRVNECQGMFYINSTKGNGTTIIISIPLIKENIIE